MYGLSLPDVIHEVRAHNRILVIVGAEKVPGDIYGLADYNIAVTGQPHSEISSLALFLDNLFLGKEFACEFPNARIHIIPTRMGKQTVER
jgi:tRNA (cytidine56-2'-O)-methyltransferase